MSRYAEDETALGVPPVLRMRVVAVELQLRTDGVEVKDVRVTVSVRNVRDAIRATAQREGQNSRPIFWAVSHSASQKPMPQHPAPHSFHFLHTPDDAQENRGRPDSACRVAEFGRRKAYPPADSPSIRFHDTKSTEGVRPPSGGRTPKTKVKESKCLRAKYKSKGIQVPSAMCGRRNGPRRPT